MRSSRLTALARRGSSIRFRIVILALIAAAPLFVDRVRLLEANRAERIATAGAQALALARAGVEKQEDVTVAARALLQTVGHAIERVTPQSRECNRLLADIASDVPWIRSLAVVNLQGRFVCSSNPQNLGLDVSDRAFFQRTLAEGGVITSGLLYPRAGNQPGIVVAHGKRGANHQIEMVISSLVDLRSVAQVTDVVEQRPGAVAFLVDSDGIVLAGRPDPEAWFGRDVTNHALMAEVLERKRGTLTAVGFDNTRRVWGFLPVSGGNTYLLVGIDEREIIGRIDREIALAYLQLLLIAVLVLMGTWIFGEHTILRPIRALARKAERIGRGDLTIRSSTDRQWATEFLPLVRSLDSMAARLAVREHQLRMESDRFRELASIDGLTGLSNRRSFDADLAGDWARAVTQQTPLALLMIDVDHFKRYNDNYGHLAGDACLRAIGGILLAHADAECRAARYGGEEFALLIQGAGQAEALRVAQGLRRAVEDLAIPHTEAPSGVVTISIGVASVVPNRTGRIETLITAADDALYASKAARNTVTAYAPPRLAQAS